MPYDTVTQWARKPVSHMCLFLLYNTYIQTPYRQDGVRVFGFCGIYIIRPLIIDLSTETCWNVQEATLVGKKTR